MKNNNKIDTYDYSQDFSPEELIETQENDSYKGLEQQLSDIGMNIHDFV